MELLSPRPETRVITDASHSHSIAVVSDATVQSMAEDNGADCGTECEPDITQLHALQ
jgi:hypothetical protein